MVYAESPELNLSHICYTSVHDAAPRDKPVHHAEEYLEAEARAEFKSEYYEGEVFAMVGASEAHSTLVVNITASFVSQLKGKPCRAYSNDTKVQPGTADKYFYPYLSIVCGQPEFRDTAKTILLNPRVIVEVLSPSTETFDRDQKFAAYARLPSLTDYLLVAQDHPRIEHFAREDGRWIYTQAAGIEAVLDMLSIECRLPLGDVYDRVEFQPITRRA